ncbi:MAG TPA: T9SS type A sorting domain-containing protein [Saprospiraceae bacterium]|nr:T9SS type A sorting domain-containing protein [Saprospiraceae bacterium]HPI07475.1 T9SS type A sorting domain-containing protein [Saprospiraceae bacterium]
MKKTYILSSIKILLLFFPVLLQSQVDANRMYSAGKHVPDKSHHGHPEMDRLNRQGGHPTSNAESGLVFLNDSIYYATWDDILAPDDWYYSSKRIFQYDDAGYETEERNFFGHLNDWTGNVRYRYVYNANHQIAEKLHGGWYEENWHDYWHDKITYDDEGRPILQETDIKDSFPGDWYLKFRTAFAYNDDGNLTSIIADYRNTPAGDWIGDYKETFQYDSVGNNTEHIFYYWNEPDNFWRPSYKYDMQYDTQNQKIQQIQYQWNSLTNNWKNYIKENYSYDDEGFEIEVIRSRWAFYTTGWDLKDRDVYLYNAAHQPTETINYLRDHVAETWNSFDRYEYHYDGNGNLHEYILYGRNNTADDWEYDYKYVYYWSEHNITTPVRENRALTCLIYPNPAGNVLFIEGLQEPAQAAIYSAQGQLLHTFRVTGTPTDISNLPAGAYFIQFTCGSKTFTRRFLKD